MGLSSALLEETTVADGVLSPANFGAYRILIHGGRARDRGGAAAG